MNITLKFYEQNAQDYVESTINLDMKQTCDNFLSLLKPQSLICDLGCGSGRDSLYFIQKGHMVFPIDGSKEICLQTEKKTGLKVVNKTFEEFNYINKFDAVFACASIHHLDNKSLIDIIKKIHKSLKNDGIFYFCAKLGVGEFVDNKGRNFSLFNEVTFNKFLTENKLNKIFSYENMYVSGDRMHRPDTCWLNVVMKKEKTKIKFNENFEEKTK